ncbi:MAG TPA: hypothetical protein VIM46_03660, partial [Luteolibacter sp.]
EIDEMLTPNPQAGFMSFQLFPSEIEPLENLELISERTRGLGFSSDAVGSVLPIAFAVVRAKVA